MDDVVLSGLLNLFALFGTEKSIDKDLSHKILINYLSSHYGVKNTDSYLRLYDDLRDFYDDFPDLDKQSILTGICTKMQSRISQEEQLLVILRLMEFVGDVSDESMFKNVADLFGVGDQEFAALIAFVREDTTSPYVAVIPYSTSHIKLLYLLQQKKLLFTYCGGNDVTMNDVRVMPGTFRTWQRSGVLKASNAPTLYYFQVMEPFSDLSDVARHQSQSVELRGNHIDFRFEEGGDNGLHDFSFSLHSGEMVAIMGGSGVGKTTLLSLLNGTLRPQTGSITINGHDISDPDAKALIGFVPQDDLLIEELTVYENLWYTARLCFDGLDDASLDERVMTVLTDLGLEGAKDLKVGSAINKYISGGQRKRLNIALELIRQPAILFLDEPTSGLSSADTEMVINLLKEQAINGRLIITNIHQPSSDVFKLFDRLWLLDKGGYPIYDGNPIEAITYFKRNANYADSDVSICPVCGNANPEVILNIIEEKKLSNTGELTAQRKKTPQQWNELYLTSLPPLRVSEFPNFRTSLPPLPSTDQQRPNRLRQIQIFIQRSLRAKMTNHQYILITLLEAPLLALICSVLTRYAPPEGYSVMENNNLVSYYFMAIIVATFLGMSGSAEEIIRDKALLKRERFLSLSYKSYVWSKIIIMAMVTLLQTALFIVVGNLIMGIHSLFMTWWMILFVTAFLAGLTGLFLSKYMNSIVSIYITIPLLLIPQILLCGLVVKFSDLTPKSTTGNVPLIGDLIPSRWSFEALAVSSFADNAYEAQFFDIDKQKYESQYYRLGYLQTLKEQLARRVRGVREVREVRGERGLRDESQLQYNLHLLAHQTGLPPYTGDCSYASLAAYYDDADSLLRERSYAATREANRLINDVISLNGREALKQLKRENYNLQLERQVVGIDASELCRVVDGHIVPLAGFIYLTPTSHNGRAPFYSGEKVIGNWHVKTLWYNMSVLVLMSMIVTLTLMYDLRTPSLFMYRKLTKTYKYLKFQKQQTV